MAIRIVSPFCSIVSQCFSTSVKRQTVPCLDALELIKVEQNPSALVEYSEWAASWPNGPNFAYLFVVMQRSSEIYSSFSSKQFINLVSLYSRLDFVDDSLCKFVDEYLGSTVGNSGVISGAQYPILFCSLLRLGIDVDEILVGNIISQLSEISDSGCLMMLHSIIRRGKNRVSPAMMTLANNIADRTEWSLGMSIQAIHVLSRLDINNEDSIAKLFKDINIGTIKQIPAANLQHVLSIIYNHSKFHDRTVWEPVLTLVVKRIGEQCAKFPLPTLAVTMAYLGRFSTDACLSNNTYLHVFDRLLEVFVTGSLKRGNPDFATLVERILAPSSGLDIAHLTSVLEACERISSNSVYVNFLLWVTIRLVLREGVHNVRAAPLCQLISAIIHHTPIMRLDTCTEIDQYINEAVLNGKVATSWSLKTNVSYEMNDTDTIIFLLEGLLRHEQYIRATQSAIERCLEIRQKIQSMTIPKNISQFLDSL